jgi:bacillopeptidase F (M6 metalloprotease family)
MAVPDLAWLMLSVTGRHSWELFKAATMNCYQDECLTPDEYHGPQNIGLLHLYTHEGEVFVAVPDD